jgi:hypothetical protein
MTTTRDSPAGDDAVRLVVRVWLPDRPGALGLVASRIGAIGADIVGIDVLERSEHVAVDEFSVVIASTDLIKLLVREIEEVDGASVEQWERVDRFPDASLDALETVEHVFDVESVDALWCRLVERVQAEFGSDWAAMLRDAEVLAKAGEATPDAFVLDALATGTGASPSVAAGDSGPEDLAVAPLVANKAVLLVGRDGHPFRRRERHQLLALARIADRAASLLPQQVIG